MQIVIKIEFKYEIDWMIDERNGEFFVYYEWGVFLNFFDVFNIFLNQIFNFFYLFDEVVDFYFSGMNFYFFFDNIKDFFDQYYYFYVYILLFYVFIFRILEVGIGLWVVMCCIGVCYFDCVGFLVVCEMMDVIWLVL